MPRSPKKNDADLLRALSISEENERECIAKQIHQVNTLLSLVKMNLKKAGRNSGDKKAIEKINEENQKALEESMKIISRSVRELGPPMFSQVGFVSALAELCRRANMEGKDVQFVTKENAVPDLSTQRGLQLYRLCKELLQCLLRHARSNKVRITLSSKGKNHELRLDHDGLDERTCKETHNDIEARALLAGVRLKRAEQFIEIKIGRGKNN